MFAIKNQDWLFDLTYPVPDIDITDASEKGDEMFLILYARGPAHPAQGDSGRFI